MTRHSPTMLYSLQIGRALAALAVVATHAAMATRALVPTMDADAYTLLRLGYLGVDYFFVLSGFIIAHATAPMQPHVADARRYMRSRLLRIYVPYLPVSLAMVMAFALVPALSMGVGGQYSLGASLFLWPSDAMPALTVARTLQHEMVFYVLFGVFFFLCKKPALIFLWALPILALVGTELSPSMDILLGPINLEFLFGVGAYQLYRQRRLGAQRYLLIGLGAVMVVAACVALFHGGLTAHYRMLAGFGFAWMVLGLVYVEMQVDMRRFRALVFLGSASYAIYLAHNPFISLLLRVLPTTWPWAVTFAVIAVISIFAGVAYFWCVERPLMAAAKRRVTVGR